MSKAIVLIALLFSFSLSAFAQRGIRDIDFRNFTYEADFCQTELTKKITVSDGQFSEEKEVDGYTDRRYFSVFDPTYGDLDGDGKDEAVVISVCNTGGTGNFTEAYVFAIKDGEVRRMVTLEGGDRAYGGLREIRIEGGRMIVEANDPGEMGGACCPEVVVTRTYRLQGNSLEETDRPQKRDLFPVERLTFEKGAFSATVGIELDYDPGIKRYVIAASKGQTLTVTSPSDEVRFRMIKGEAEIEEENKTLVAELSDTGDYIFEVRNFSEGALSTNITITIR